MSDGYTGLVIPEEVLREAIDEGLTALQKNPDLLQRLLQRYDDDVKNEVLNYITKRDMRVTLGFARNLAEGVPQITVTLESEPDEQFLGGEMLLRDSTLPVTAKLGADLYPIQPMNLPADIPYSDLVGTLPDKGRIVIDDEEMTYTAYTPDEETEGAGTFRIAGRGANGTKQEFHPVGSAITFIKREHIRGMHVIGRYRIDILSFNGDVTRWLNQLVKVILIQQYDALSGAGMGQFNINGTDFAPRPEWYPHFIYMRTLMFQARIEVSVPQELVEILKVETYPTVTDMTQHGVIDP